eukprot:5056387-Alexandrium_andersonii.AAC.1
MKGSTSFGNICAHVYGPHCPNSSDEQQLVPACCNYHLHAYRGHANCLVQSVFGAHRMGADQLLPIRVTTIECAQHA